MTTAPSPRTQELEEHLPPHLRPYAKFFAANEAAFGVDAYLLAAICDRESKGGLALSTKRPDGTGDKGHGRGLMQIDDRWHPSFINAKTDSGVPLWTLPAFNIAYGASVFARYRDILDGDELAAIAAYNAGPGNVAHILEGTPEPVDRVKLLDAVTTGHNYVSDVLRRRNGFIHQGVS